MTATMGAQAFGPRKVHSHRSEGAGFIQQCGWGLRPVTGRKQPSTVVAGLAAHIRAGISGLVNRIRTMLEQQHAYAPEQIQSLLDQLSGTMMRAAAESKNSVRKRKWAGLGIAVEEGLGTIALYDATKSLATVGLVMMGIEVGS